MRFVILLLVIIGINAVHAQSDLELVKSFGKALESNPMIATGQVSGKYIALYKIWNVKGGAREKVEEYIRTEPFSDTVIYDTSKYLSSFLIEAYETKNTQWIKEIAQLYLLLLDEKKLVEKETIIFDFPAKLEKNPPTKEKYSKYPYKTKRNFKLWLNSDGRENTISSSQFLYGVSVIIHYAIKNKLEKDKILGPFIRDYYDVAMNHHYLRWILNVGIEIGSFQAKAWRCNSGNFSHKQHVENLYNNRYGTVYFKDIGEGLNEVRGFCNFYQDRDGYIATGLAHLMAANRLNPNIINIDDKTYDELHEYLQSSLDLFKDRSKIIDNSMVFDLGGFYNHQNLAYSGVTEENYPGKTTIKKVDLNPLSKWDELIKRYKGRIVLKEDAIMKVDGTNISYNLFDLEEIKKDNLIKTVQNQWDELKKELEKTYPRDAIKITENSSIFIKELPLTFKRSDLEDMIKNDQNLKFNEKNQVLQITRKKSNIDKTKLTKIDYEKEISKKWQALTVFIKNIHKGGISVDKDDKDDITIYVNDFTLPPAPKVSWDASHAWRFVNYFWTFEKTITELDLNFDYKFYRKAYANNLYHNTLKKTDDGKFYYFANYLCGHDGWYRVNYQCESPCKEGNLTGNIPGSYLNNYGTPSGTPSLNKAVISWGQAYFVKYNKQLQEPMIEMYIRHISNIKIDGKQKAQTVSELLSATASMPEEFFKSKKIEPVFSPKPSKSF